ncbi:MAG: chemotaxis protein CheX [Akkermansiaceae bacterium]|nr:chemotaxis protein CheX [Akkermansiaceae bacterium]
MEESILRIFAQCIIRYFNTITGEPATMTAPFLGSSNEELSLDFSAVIGVSGNYRGNVFYTASREKLEQLLPLLGEHSPNETLCIELVGEMTNTYSGNAREELGGSFMISTPLLLQGKNQIVRPAPGIPCYILPIEWKGHQSRLLISLAKAETNSKYLPDTEGP